MSLGVEVTAARAGVARNVCRIRTGVADAGVSEANVTTAGFGIAPIYDFDDGERRLRGHRGAHSLAVEAEPGRAGETVDGVRFTPSDALRAELRATALDRAMTAARGAADGIAAADLSVTGVSHAAAGTEFEVFPVARFEDVTGAETVFQPAPVTVTATVDVTYAAA